MASEVMRDKVELEHFESFEDLKDCRRPTAAELFGREVTTEDARHMMDVLWCWAIEQPDEPETPQWRWVLSQFIAYIDFIRERIASSPAAQGQAHHAAHHTGGYG